LHLKHRYLEMVAKRYSLQNLYLLISAEPFPELILPITVCIKQELILCSILIEFNDWHHNDTLWRDSSCKCASADQLSLSRPSRQHPPLWGSCLLDIAIIRCGPQHGENFHRQNGWRKSRIAMIHDNWIQRRNYGMKALNSFIFHQCQVVSMRNHQKPKLGSLYQAERKNRLVRNENKCCSI
jgi:hypothetical protein